MAPKGKRKAPSSASPTKTPRPRKKINLNGTASSPSRSTRSKRAALVEQQEEEDHEPKVPSSGEQPAPSTSEAAASSTSRLPRLSSRLSISSFSIPFLHRTSSFSSASSPNLNKSIAQEGVLSRVTSSFAPVKSLFSSRMKKSNGKGKQRQVDEKEVDHLSAQESARMIELLDTPVSVKIQAWQPDMSSEEVSKRSDAGKGSERQAASGHEREERSSGRGEMLDQEDPSTEPMPGVKEDQVEPNGAAEADEGANHHVVRMEESQDVSLSASSPLEENGLLPIRFTGVHSQLDERRGEHAAGSSVDQVGDISVDDAGVSAEEGRTHDGIFTPERDLGSGTSAAGGNNGEEVKPAEGVVPSEGFTKDQIEARSRGGELEQESADQVNQGAGASAVVEQVVEHRKHPTLLGEGTKAITDEVTEQVGHLSVEEGAEQSRMSYQEVLDTTGKAENVSDDEEEILIPSSQARQEVIDLTDSVSPEPEAPAARTALPRHKPSGFFSSGLLAREKLGHSFPASRAIQQLGQRQVSSPSVTSKASRRSLSGFRKKDPIFSQARKSMAKSITHSKVDDMLTSLKRYVKKTMHTPFLDDMLRKRIALAKVLQDETPEDEIQIRHLREILKRSTYSLRPARRQLKEQERLEHEAKLLRKRALGIMGRQPLASSLAPDQEEVVTQTFQKQGNIAQMPGAGVVAKDIAKLKPSQWLNDEVINFYMKLILKRSDEAVLKRKDAREAKKRLVSAAYTSEEERTKDIASVRDVKKVWNGVRNVWTFNSFFWVKITGREGYAGVRQWTRKVDIFTKDVVLLPINMGQLHWVCAAINMRQCRFEYYDSLRGKNKAVFAVLRDYLASEYQDKKKGSAGSLDLSGWTNYFSRQSPTQATGWDCGVFACQTLEQLSRRSPAGGDPMDNLTVEEVVKKSIELAEQRRKAKGAHAGSNSDSESGSEAEDDEVDYNDAEEEEWNFSQSDMPYLRRRMVYEIAKTRLLDE